MVIHGTVLAGMQANLHQPDRNSLLHDRTVEIRRAVVVSVMGVSASHLFPSYPNNTVEQTVPAARQRLGEHAYQVA